MGKRRNGYPRRLTNRAARPRPAPAPPVAGKSWYRIENKAGTDTTEVYLYDEIGFWGVPASEFVDELRAITTPKIDLHVNSPGGEIFDGIAIYNAILGHKATVTAYVDGLAASAASFIVQAAERVLIDRHAQMMIHDGQGICVGDSRDMRQLADLLDRSSDNIASIYAERAGGTVTAWRNRMREETWYSAAEAVDVGLADELTGTDPQARPARRDEANSWDLSVFRYPGRGGAPAPDTTAPVARPANRAPAQPVDEPVTDEPVEEPVTVPVTEPNPAVISFDLDEFRNAVTTGVDQLAGYNPELFRAAITLGLNDVPAPDPPAPAPGPADEPAIRIDHRDILRALKEAAL